MGRGSYMDNGFYGSYILSILVIMIVILSIFFLLYMFQEEKRILSIYQIYKL
jgi:uncharacterized membrane protein